MVFGRVSLKLLCAALDPALLFNWPEAISKEGKSLRPFFPFNSFIVHSKIPPSSG